MTNLLFRLLTSRADGIYADISILILRFGIGLSMLFGHGWGKLFGYSTMVLKFGDPLGIGAPASLALAAFAEFFCSIAIALGFFTRFASIALIVNMSVAAFIAHAGAPFARRELAILYLIVYLALLLLGGGRYSLDHLLWRRKLPAQSL